MRDIGLMTALKYLASSFIYACLDRELFFGLPSAQRMQMRLCRRPQQRGALISKFSAATLRLRSQNKKNN